MHFFILKRSNYHIFSKSKDHYNIVEFQFPNYNINAGTSVRTSRTRFVMNLFFNSYRSPQGSHYRSVSNPTHQGRRIKLGNPQHNIKISHYV